MIGAPGSWKSTWIKENGLEPYTISSDNVRLFFSAPVMWLNWNFSINQENDRKVWWFIDELMEFRMSRWMFTVIDATNTVKPALKKYEELCQKYGYRFYGKKFELSIEDLLLRNSQRDPLKKVPEEVISLHYRNLQSLTFNNKIQLIEEVTELFEFVSYKNVDEYKSVFVIGDIHGCYTQLKEFWDGYYNEEDIFVFVWDYIDRWPESRKTLEFLLTIYNNKNVILLEWNHELWLRHWAEDQIDKIRSQEFMSNTYGQLSGLSAKEIRLLLRKLRSFAAIEHKGRKLIITHAWVSSRNINFVNSEQFIRWVGKYEDYSIVAENFYQENCESGNPYFQINWHRNIQELPVEVNPKCFNLEGKVEFGWNLRIVKFAENIETIEIKNNEYIPPVKTSNINLEILRRSKAIIEKKFGHVSSFNFSRDVFSKGRRNSTTLKARGLFVNTNDWKIVARSYEKFFNIEEVESTELPSLRSNLVFPLSVYRKENGFLGIVGYDHQTEQVLYCSKSMLGGKYAWYLKELLIEKEALFLDILKQWYSLIFEVILPVRDPHIIEYPGDKVVLLDVIRNDFLFEKKTYLELVEIATTIWVEHKQEYATLNDFGSFVAFLDQQDESCFDEWFVFEDQTWFMMKYKSPFYKFRKKIRWYRDLLLLWRSIELSEISDKNLQNVVRWLVEQNKELWEYDIIRLRKLYLDFQTGMSA